MLHLRRALVELDAALRISDTMVQLIWKRLWSNKALLMAYFVDRQHVELAATGSGRAVMGNWLADGDPTGVGIREFDGSATGNTSRSVPHLFR
jgi:glutathionylspermidine synthase